MQRRRRGSTTRVENELAVVGRNLLADGHFDNEPDAVRAAIWLLACADALEQRDAATADEPPVDGGAP